MHYIQWFGLQDRKRSPDCTTYQVPCCDTETLLCLKTPQHHFYGTETCGYGAKFSTTVNQQCLCVHSVSSNPCLSPGFPAFFPTWISICLSPLPCNDSHLSLPSISPLFYFSTSLPGLYSPFFSSLFLALPTPWTDMDVPLSIAVISANCLDRVKEFSSLSFYCKQPLNTRSSISKYRCTAGWVHIDYHDTSNSRNDK